MQKLKHTRLARTLSIQHPKDVSGRLHVRQINVLKQHPSSRDGFCSPPSAGLTSPCPRGPPACPGSSPAVPPCGRVFRTREVSINPLIWFDAEELSLSLQSSWKDLKKEASGVLAPWAWNQTLRSSSLKRGNRHPVSQSRQIAVHDVQLTKTDLQHSEPEGPWCRSLPPLLLGHLSSLICKGHLWNSRHRRERGGLGVAQQNHLQHTRPWCFAASLPGGPGSLQNCLQSPMDHDRTRPPAWPAALATWRCNHSSTWASETCSRTSDDGKELSQIVGQDVKMGTDSWWCAVLWTFMGP